MSVRPVYIPSEDHENLVISKNIDFVWFPGFSVSQKRKSILSLHSSIKKEISLKKILEISTKSPEKIGVQASAFNLQIEYNSLNSSIESIYQGSKVFKNGGPYSDLYNKKSIYAKKDMRLKTSGDLICFDFLGEKWELNEDFYSWLYLLALTQNNIVKSKLLNYEAFTDIEFNPKKSFNCQAYSAALYVSFIRKNISLKNIYYKDKFIQLLPNKIFKSQLNIFNQLDL